MYLKDNKTICYDRAMVIGFDASRAFAGERTGTENYSYQLLKALAKIDKKNKYIVYLRSEGPTLQEWPGNFSFKVLNFPRLWTQLGLAIQTFKDPLDMLFVPAHTIPLIKKPGLKTVVTVHDLGSEYLPSTHQFKQRFYLGFMQKYQLNTATKIIAVSKATKKDLVKKIGIEEDKISVIYEGYDKEKFKVLPAGRHGQNSKFKINQRYFLFVGTVQPRKNLERLITAFAVFLSLTPRNDEVDLVIAGSKGWLSDEIYKLPKKLGIEDKVKFLGYVPDKDLPALYSRAIALTYPSLFEGFGLPILEAQASGCPVLTSNISSMPEVAGKTAVFVDPYSIDDIVEGMRKVQSAKFKVQIVKAGFENIKRFSWEKCAKETLEVLEKQ